MGLRRSPPRLGRADLDQHNGLAQFCRAAGRSQEKGRFLKRLDIHQHDFRTRLLYEKRQVLCNLEVNLITYTEDVVENQIIAPSAIEKCKT